MTEENWAEMYAAIKAEHDEQGAREQLAAGWKKWLAQQNPAGLQLWGLLLRQQRLEEAGLVQNSWTIRLSVPRQGESGRTFGGGGGCCRCGGAGRAVARWGGAAGRPGRRPVVAIPGQLLMSLRAMKSAQEPVAVGLARIVQEQLATGLAGMDQHKYA